MSAKTFNVYLVKYGMTKLTQLQLSTCRARVKAELDTIAKASRNKVRFAVSLVRQTSTTSDRDFVVYLIPAKRFVAAVSLAKRRVPDLGKNSAALKKLHRQFQMEGGAAITSGKKSVAFVAVEKYEISRDPFTDYVKQQKHWGNELAHMVLHELGHCMGVLTHCSGGGLMQIPVPVRTMAAGQTPIHFSSRMRTKFVRHLLNLSP